MPLTVRIIDRNKLGNFWAHTVQITGDSSHDVGGEDLTAADLGFSDPASTLVFMGFSSQGYVPEYVGSTQKFNVRHGNYPAATAGALTTADNVNLSAVTFTALVLGKRPIMPTQGA